jgi:pullulanase/glycogen debranching enzyme
MTAILFMSLGIPMIAAGQDFLRSKHGVTNTYLRGDLNALDYRRWRHYQSTHTYFAEWIAFRRGDLGRLVRRWSRPAEGFFAFVNSPHSPALLVVYNADRSQGAARLLFGLNPSDHEITFALPPDLSGRAGRDGNSWLISSDFIPARASAALCRSGASHLAPAGLRSLGL